MVDETNENGGIQNSETPTDSQVVDEKPTQPNPAQPNEDSNAQVVKPKISFTNEQKEYIKDLMRKRVERSHQRFFDRYGAKDLNDLDGIFAKVGKYDEMNGKVEQLTTENASLSEQLAFIRNNVNPDKYEDIRRYFKGGDVVFSEATLIAELAKHPEWIKGGSINPNANVINKPTTTIQTLCPERGHEIQESEDEKMNRIFGLKKK